LVWERISELARLAPTPHNTQPFRIVPRSARTADLIVLRDRLLPREDHGNLYMACAFGIFSTALEHAGRYVGRELVVDIVPQVDVARLHAGDQRIRLGTAALGAPGPVGPGETRRTMRIESPNDLSALFRARRTSRLPYYDRDVLGASIAELAHVAAVYGHRFLSFNDAPTVNKVLRLNVDAIIDNLQIRGEREEIQSWYRYGPTPRDGDGLWEQPMNQPAWELRSAFMTPRLFGLPGFRQFARRRYLRTQTGTRHIGLLCGPFAEWPDLVHAGRMLMAFWLEMATHDVYMQPMGSMLTNPKYASAIAKQFRVGDCWLVFRFGYSDEPPRAPRLRTVVERE
jgi:nitroreductase